MWLSRVIVLIRDMMGVEDSGRFVNDSDSLVISSGRLVISVLVVNGSGRLVISGWS